MVAIDLDPTSTRASGCSASYSGQALTRAVTLVHPWDDTTVTRQRTGSPAGHPLGIDILADGSLVIGILDRFGHQAQPPT